jgi:hypothetical protein
MASFIFRCPVTRETVQGWLASKPTEASGDVYEGVACIACNGSHLINFKTGKMLDSDEQ